MSPLNRRTTLTTPVEAASVVEHLSASQNHVVVGVSGYAGSGKSTLARELLKVVDGMARIRGDDFLDPTRSHRRSANWDGVDRVRLRQEVIEPFRTGLSGPFRRYDWSTRKLGQPEPLPDARVLIIDGIGLFHPELDGVFDLTIWVDVEPEVAAQRGRRRDRELGRQHDLLWDEVWVPNDHEFEETFRPRERADVVYRPGSA